MTHSFNRKVGIIGSGFVGSASAFSLMQSGLFSEMVLIDVDRNRAEGEALDIAHGIPLSSPMEIYAGDYSDLADASAVVITAGVGQKPGETRVDLVQRNASIFKAIIPQINASGFSGILLVVSNPVDILTDITMRLSNLPEQRIIGSGTVLDSARLKYALGKIVGVDSHHVHARIVGEHGDSEFPIWSSANVAGIPIEQCLAEAGITDPAAKLDALAEEVRNSAYEIIEKKKFTNYGIAASVTSILKSIIRDEKTIMCVSNRQESKIAQGVVLSMPAVIGAQGIERKLDIPLDDSETAKLEASAQTITKIIEAVDLPSPA